MNSLNEYLVKYLNREQLLEVKEELTSDFKDFYTLLKSNIYKDHKELITLIEILNNQIEFIDDAISNLK